jgi:hypothetical protein
VTIPTIAELLPKLAVAFGTGPAVMVQKDRMLLGHSIAQILSSQEISPPGVKESLIRFVCEGLKDSDFHCALKYASIVAELRTPIGDVDAAEICGLLAELVGRARFPPELDVIYSTLKPLLKSYTVPFDVMQPFTSGFLGGTLAIFAGSPAHAQIGKVDLVFAVVSLLIDLYKESGAVFPALVEPLLKWVDSATEWSSVLIFNSLEVAVLSHLLDENLCRILARSALKSFQDGSSTQIVLAATTLFDAILVEHRDALVPIEEFVQPFEHVVAAFDVKEEDMTESIMESEEELMPAIATFVLQVYRENRDIQVNQPLFLSIINLMPPSALEEMESWIANLHDLVTVDPRFTFAKEALAIFFVQIFIVNPEEFTFPLDLRRAMGLHVKQCTESDPSLQQRIEKVLTTPARIREFRALLK